LHRRGFSGLRQGRYSTALRGAPEQFESPGLAAFSMANIHSQKKRILRSERERIENRQYTSAIKTHFRRLETLVKDGDDATADATHRELVSTIDKAVKRGAIHRNNGAHKKSRAARLRAGSSAE
jgi:small subunit ribosomal protein S20